MVLSQNKKSPLNFLAMNFSNVSINSVAHFEAPNRVTSTDISARLAKTLKRLRLPLNYLERTTGIEERRFWHENTQPSDAATHVAEMVIQKSGLAKSDIGVIINTSISKDFIEPSIAAIIHGNLKLSANCINFDVGNACLGFLNGIHVAATMIEGGQVNHALVVAAENAGTGVLATIDRLEKNDATPQEVRSQLASLTLGSGAAAMVVSRSNLAPRGHSVRGLVALAATEHSRLCCAWADTMKTDAPKILENGMILTANTFQEAKKQLDWDVENIHEFVIHQISNTHLQVFQKQFNIESNKVMTIIQKYGNMGPVSVPFIVSKLEIADRLTPGKRLRIVGTGSGLNCMIMDVLW
jgi:acyl-CoA:acyl-CoA alkyltransferase